MPYAANEGVRIYYETEGAGPPLLLHHAFTGRLRAWRTFGYVEPLRARYRLILMDARGHGASDKPYDRDAYRMAARVADVVAVLDAAGVDAAHFAGYAMGGAVGFALARLAPARLRSLVIGGAHPYPVTVSAFPDVDGASSEVFAHALETTLGERLTPETRTQALANDLRALAAAGQAESSLGVPTLTVPCLLFVGAADRRHADVQRYAAETPGTTFVALPGQGHVQAMTRSDLVLPHVTAFLDALEKA
jgi:pimeloyl-ACP methyl ester carboxylesterase